MSAEPRVFFTSDPHFFHANVIRHADRPFSGLEDMHAQMADRWEAAVGPRDTVWIVGDLALGRTQEALDLVASLPGRKLLVPGNHDRMWSANKETATARARWAAAYAAAGLEVLPEQADTVLVDERTGERVCFQVAHLPAGNADSHDRARYESIRPSEDDPRPLIHGHTHSRERVSRSPRGRLLLHAGVDAWGFQPVPGQWFVDAALGREDGAAQAG